LFSVEDLTDRNRTAANDHVAFSQVDHFFDHLNSALLPSRADAPRQADFEQECGNENHEPRQSSGRH